MRQVELDARIAGPFDPAHVEGGPQESLGRHAVLRRYAEDEEGRVHEEDQLASGFEDPRCLGDPAIGVRPEARAVFRDRQVERSIAARHALGVRLDQRELETVHALKAARGRELGRRGVDPDDTHAAAREPGRHIGGTAPELDAGLAGQTLGQDAELRFGHAPDAPGRLLSRPCPLAAGDIVPRLGVPANAVTPHVLRQHALVGHRPRSTSAPRPSRSPGHRRDQPAARRDHPRVSRDHARARSRWASRWAWSPASA